MRNARNVGFLQFWVHLVDRFIMEKIHLGMCGAQTNELVRWLDLKEEVLLLLPQRNLCHHLWTSLSRLLVQTLQSSSVDPWTS